jgi:hypothetical protein
LSRDAEIDRFVDDMKVSGVPVRERIARLKAYIRRRSKLQPPDVS